MNDDNGERTEGPDPMEEGFDHLRLSATKLRMMSEQGHQHVAAVDTGNPDIDALLRQALSGLIDRTTQFADHTDHIVEHFHPLYLEDKRAGRAGFKRDEDEGS